MHEIIRNYQIQYIQMISNINLNNIYPFDHKETCPSYQQSYEGGGGRTFE